MPELPEVEVVRAALEPWLAGRTLRWARRVEAPAGPKYHGLERVAGQRVLAVTRRGKFLVMPLDSGESLVVHLGMTGVLSGTRPDDHLRVEVALEGRRENRLYFRDPRRFGRFVCLSPGEEALLPTLAAMGPEPLSPAFSVAHLRQGLERRGAGLKVLLLGQRLVAGVGNIYADEALWRAKLHPERPASSVTAEEAESLWRAIREVLAEAIADGGTTLRDYRTVSGERGAHQEALGVYGRAGATCPRCAAVLERLVVGQRGTTFCPRCQVAKKPGRRR
jgi:formamidopyrimidine-DNA glycosylase